MSDQYPVSVCSAAVRAHLSILQEIIKRMADNSRSSKTWCITLVAAILILVARRQDPAHNVLIGLLPIILFLVLDAYYLALEKGFRAAYDQFVSSLHNGRVKESDLYVVARRGQLARLWGRALCSPSVWPFYSLVAGLLAVVWGLVEVVPEAAEPDK